MSKGNVLIFDDHLLMRDTLKTLLQNEGFAVSCCASGREGLELAKKSAIGIFLVDYRMPDMNGDEVTVVLRTLFPGAVIIGFSIECREREFLKAGADKYIDKGQLDEKLVQYLNDRIRMQIEG
jgi:CheY-like chemotaxis protein